MRRQLLTIIASAATAVLISGCASQRTASGMDPRHGERQPDMAARMERMCDMHKQMTEGKSPEEQRAAVESHVKAMHGTASPEMIDHHLKMMQMHCRPQKPTS